MKWNGKIVGMSASVLVLVMLVWGWWVSEEPAVFSVSERVQSINPAATEQPPVGVYTTTALIEVLNELLHKRGGYLSNDVMPPTVWLDDLPSWEFGALEMSRDLALAMRREFSRSQSQSLQMPQLTAAQTSLNIDHESWMLPVAESEYANAVDSLRLYRQALLDGNFSAQFYARADNLRSWIAEVEKRLGSLSQRLSASVAQVDAKLAEEIALNPATQQLSLQTSWWEIDDVFYEARGASYALLHFLKAVEVDFADVLENKNAAVSMRQIITELEATQQPVWSPMILNGSGFGFVANHSLVMANYVSRANAALIDIKDLLAQG